jgi:sporulation protein YlmC with PRC-barrel domain
MSSSILSAIERSLSVEDIGRMAAAAGIAPDVATRAVDAGVPAILSALTTTLARPQGAQQLTAALARQPAGRLETLAAALDGSPQTAEAGANPLTALLGSASLATLTMSLAKFVGIPERSARTILNALMPAITWALGRERRSKGIGAAGLVDMLQSQKAEIAAAVPKGLADLLRANGLYDRLRISALPPEVPASSACSAPAAALAKTVLSRSRATWPFVVLPLLALAGLAWYLLADGSSSARLGQRSEVSGKPSTAPPGTGDAIQYLATVPSDVVSVATYQRRDVFNRTGEKIGTVTDLVVDNDGRITAAIISVGSFLGLGDKEVAVPFSAVQRWQHDSLTHLMIDAERGELHAAPPVQASGVLIRSRAPSVRKHDLPAPPLGGQGDGKQERTP